MRKNEIITFELSRSDLESLLGFLSVSIAKLEKTEMLLKDIVEIVRITLQEDDVPEMDPDCESCFIPCEHNPNFKKEANDYPEFARLFHELMQVSDEMKQNRICEDSMEQMEEYLKDRHIRHNDKKVDPEEMYGEPRPENSAVKISAKEPENSEEASEESEAESLAIELLKAVFSVLAETIENGE